MSEPIDISSALRDEFGAAAALTRLSTADRMGRRISQVDLSANLLHTFGS